MSLRAVCRIALAVVATSSALRAQQLSASTSRITLPLVADMFERLD
jgi:hypothetical protein